MAHTADQHQSHRDLQSGPRPTFKIDNQMLPACWDVDRLARTAHVNDQCIVASASVLLDAVQPKVCEPFCDAKRCSDCCAVMTDKDAGRSDMWRKKHPQLATREYSVVGRRMIRINMPLVEYERTQRQDERMDICAVSIQTKCPSQHTHALHLRHFRSFWDLR